MEGAVMGQSFTFSDSPEIIQSQLTEIVNDFERAEAGWQEKNLDFAVREVRLTIELALAQATLVPWIVEAVEEKIAELAREQHNYAREFLYMKRKREVFPGFISQPEWYPKAKSEYKKRFEEIFLQVARQD
jgi:hypothetical protein